MFELDRRAIPGRSSFGRADLLALVHHNKRSRDPIRWPSFECARSPFTFLLAAAAAVAVATQKRAALKLCDAIGRPSLAQLHPRLRLRRIGSDKNASKQRRRPLLSASSSSSSSLEFAGLSKWMKPVETRNARAQNYSNYSLFSTFFVSPRRCAYLDDDEQEKLCVSYRLTQGGRVSLS